MSGKITLKDMYLQYPYKTRPIEGNTVPIPYFPKDQITDTKHTVGYKEWRNILNAYLLMVQDYIATGKEFKIPHDMGELRMMKHKPRRNKPIDFHKTKLKYGDINKTLPEGQKKKVYHTNKHTRGYAPFIKWTRRNNKLKHKWLWRFKYSKTAWKRLSDKINSDISLINKYIEI